MAQKVDHITVFDPEIVAVILTVEAYLIKVQQNCCLKSNEK